MSWLQHPAGAGSWKKIFQSESLHRCLNTTLTLKLKRVLQNIAPLRYAIRAPEKVAPRLRSEGQSPTSTPLVPVPRGGRRPLMQSRREPTDSRRCVRRCVGAVFTGTRVGPRTPSWRRRGCRLRTAPRRHWRRPGSGGWRRTPHRTGSRRPWSK